MAEVPFDASGALTLAAPPREIVLLGGGHAHVQVLRHLRMAGLPGARVTVVTDRPTAIYSGMVPGFVAGTYPARALEIDIWTLAHAVGARVIVAAGTHVDVATGRVHVDGRPPVPFDLLSLDIGSTVAGLDCPGVREHALATRPIGDFVARLDAVLAPLHARGPGSPPRILVVGAGAGGVELAFTLQHRTGGAVTLLDAHEGPLRGQATGVVARVRAAAARRSITLRSAARVQAVEPGRVLLEGGEAVPFDALVWATGAAAHPLGRASGLPCDDAGFIRVRDTLQVEGHDHVFAVGDCAAFTPSPLPKAGVYAVREGPVLIDNLTARLTDRPVRPYRPQRDFLALLNLGDGTAIGAKAGIAFEGAWVWRWKDRIDRRFMAMFQALDEHDAPALPPMAGDDMECGGCAAKVDQAALASALSRLPLRPDPSVEVGVETPDDVAVVRTTGGGRLAWTVDAFVAFDDDPWLVGRIAAANALNDLYAKGLSPRWALAVVTVPGSAGAEGLYAVMAGVRATLDPLGIALVGGHSMRGEAWTVGLSVTAEVGATLRRVDQLRVGDALVLTGKLGSGVLIRANALGRARGAWMLDAYAAMMRPHADACRVAATADVSAATDVTGFGLAGHLTAMARTSGVSLRVDPTCLPPLDGVASLLAQGVRSTAHATNRAAARGVEGAGEDRGGPTELLFDPQTAGPLLLAVHPRDADPLVHALRAAGYPAATRIGAVLPPAPTGALLTIEASTRPPRPTP